MKAEHSARTTRLAAAPPLGRLAAFALDVATYAIIPVLLPGAKPVHDRNHLRLAVGQPDLAADSLTQAIA